MSVSVRSDVTVVGGGWSVRNVAIDRLAGTIVAVNDSALHLPRWNHAVSMDRVWTEKRIGSVVGRMNEDSWIWIRKNALQNIGEVGSVTPFTCDHETDEFSSALKADGEYKLNGRSSGGCALNLAWHLRPARLFLLGFDMNSHPRHGQHWYPPYPWGGGTCSTKFVDWALGMTVAARRFEEIGTRVFNVSPASSINAFQRITPAEYLRLTE